MFISSWSALTRLPPTRKKVDSETFSFYLLQTIAKNSLLGSEAGASERLNQSGQSVSIGIMHLTDHLRQGKKI